MVVDTKNPRPGESPPGIQQECLRRRVTLPHPAGCSTITVPGLSFRVRKGTGRHTWAMATAKTTTDGPDPQNRDPDRPKKTTHAPPPARAVTVREPASGRETKRFVTIVFVNIPALIVAWNNPAAAKDADPPHTRSENGLLCRRRPLVPVGSTPRGASTSGLSNTCSTCGLQRFKTVRNPNLGAGFPLRCFQRLSLPNVANRPCRWRDNRHTRGSSTQVLSYYGQASPGFQRAQRIETKLSHDVLNPARVPL